MGLAPHSHHIQLQATGTGADLNNLFFFFFFPESKMLEPTFLHYEAFQVWTVTPDNKTQAR